MSRVLIGSIPHSVATYKRVPTTDGLGTKAQQDGWQSAMIDVYVDVNALVRSLGSRVLRSQGKRSILQGGAVELKARNIETRTVEVSQ